MELQEILVAALFLLALIYISRVVYRSLKPRAGCGQGCKCGVDFSDINPDKSIKQMPKG